MTRLKLTDICERVKAPISENSFHEDLDLSSLPKSWDACPTLHKRFLALIASNDKLSRLLSKEIPKPSRSEYDFSATVILKINGWNLLETATALILSGVGKGTELTAREIVRTYNRAPNPCEEMALTQEQIDFIESTTPPSSTEATQIDENGYPKTKRLSLLKHSDVSAIDNSDPLFYGLYEKNSFNVIYGQSNVGKSFIMLDQAVALAQGKNWSNFQCVEKMAVIYIFAEAGASAGKRVEAVRRKYGIDPNAPTSEFPFYMLNVAVNFLEKPTEKIDDVGDILLLIQQAERESGLKVGMVVLDTLATTFSGGNENASEDMGSYITNCKKVQQEGKTAVFVVHHSGKDQAAGARGHSSLRAATDTEIEIKAEEKGVGKWLRELVFRKQRETETGTRVKFGLNVVELGVNKLSLPITSCQVVLEGDTDYLEIIPSVYEQLTEGQQTAYRAIWMANLIGDNSPRQIYGCYNFIQNNIGLSNILLEDEVRKNGAPLPISSNSDLIKKDSITKQWRTLHEKGLIEKDDNNQWVITSGGLEGSSGGRQDD